MSPSSDLFSVTDAEKIVGWALSRHLMQNVETDPNAKLVLSCERKTLNSELWHACAGPLVSLPQVGSLVFYFPQGHSEQKNNNITDSKLPQSSISVDVSSSKCHTSCECWVLVDLT
ncbi:hypothetical protein JHK85_000715 [Glycine max]|nr:hypothetical protein JHK85_000715 [Glycine max]